MRSLFVCVVGFIYILSFQEPPVSCLLLYAVLSILFRSFLLCQTTNEWQAQKKYVMDCLTDTVPSVLSAKNLLSQERQSMNYHEVDARGHLHESPRAYTPRGANGLPLSREEHDYAMMRRAPPQVAMPFSGIAHPGSPYDSHNSVQSRGSDGSSPCVQSTRGRAMHKRVDSGDGVGSDTSSSSFPVSQRGGRSGGSSRNSPRTYALNTTNANGHAYNPANGHEQTLIQGRKRGSGSTVVIQANWNFGS